MPFDALTVNSAKTMGLEGYGLEVGCNADLIVLQAADVVEALRLKPTRLFVVKGGRIVSRSAPRIGQLFLDGRPNGIDPGLDYVPVTR